MEGFPPIELMELKQKIVTDEISEYSDQKTLYNVISKLKNESDEAVEQFKEVLLMLTDELGRVTGDHMLNNYKADIFNFVNKNPKGIIDGFILKCYEFNNGVMRAKMVEGNESFFMNNNLENVSEGDSDIVNIIFKFKDFWGKLNNENKEIIKNSLVALISLCDIRYVNYKKYICLKKLNPSFSKLYAEYDNIF